MTQLDITKAKAALHYVLAKVGDKPNVGETVIHKLMYFIDFDYYEIHHEHLMGAEYMKNHRGPTMKKLASLLSEMEASGDVERTEGQHGPHPQKRANALTEPDTSPLTKAQISHIDSVLDRLSHMNATEISDYSHLDYPWIAAKNGDTLQYKSVFYRDDVRSVAQYDEL